MGQLARYKVSYRLVFCSFQKLCVLFADLCWVCLGLTMFSLKKKKKILKAGYCMNTWAWNNGIGLILFVFETNVTIKRDYGGYPYLTFRGEILEFTKDKQVQKHLQRVFSLINSKKL